MTAGVALPLAGGPAAFSLARILGDGPARIVPATVERAATVTRPAPSWAGLPTDRPLVMGILNVTPDSFSDDGAWDSPLGAIAAGREMLQAGADIIDIGGESTRPGALETPPELERERILPVIRALARMDAVISVDTRHADTMRAALDAGARIVNDVSGFGFDPDAAPLMRARGCAVVVMHMRGVPATMRQLAEYDDVAADVVRELERSLRQLDLDRALVAVDPGIGFAKGAGHNEMLLARLPILLNLGCRIVVGASRKGFIGRLGGVKTPGHRLSGSLAAGIAAVLGGASVLRVHDVAATVQALRVWQGIVAAA